MFNQSQKKATSAWRQLRVLLSLICILFTAMWIGFAGQSMLGAKSPYLPPYASTTDSPNRVKGTLQDTNGPINDADIYLQYFDDEKCAKLFTKKVNPFDQKAVKKLTDRLTHCARDLTPIKPDEQGRYYFEGIKPGWYAMRFLWNIHQKPEQGGAIFERSGFVIAYHPEKDIQKKYDTMAQGMPFYFSGKNDVVIDYDGKGR